LPHLARGGANQTELQLKDNTAAAWWKQQLWPPCMSWQNYLTSQLQLILWTDGTKYYSQVSHLVRPRQSFCLYANNRIGHLRKNSRTFTERLKFLWFLKLVFFCGPWMWCFFLLCFFKKFFYFYYSCIINFTITILLSPFLPSSLCLLLLCYNPLFSLPTNLSTHSWRTQDISRHENEEQEKTQKQVMSDRTSANTKVKQRTL
jgi:hypothetical protein